MQNDISMKTLIIASKNKFILFITLLLNTVQIAVAQDIQFSQFYAMPLYLNPAFAGSAHIDRATAIYRNQWSAIPAQFVTYGASYDFFSKKYNSGAGFMAMHDRAGGNLNTTHFNGLYSYELQANKVWQVRFGMQMGITHRRIESQNFVFGDQLNAQGFTGRPTQEQLDNLQANRTFFNVGSGIMAYSKTLWLGVAGHNLNRPDQSLYGNASLVPIKWTLHTGAKIPFERFALGRKLKKRKYGTSGESITPAAMYRMQGKYDQLDLGLYVHYDPIVIGAWYRGLTFFKKEGVNLNNFDALVILLGFQQENFSVGYSYDFTISQLGFNTGGSHEISFSYYFIDLNRKKKKLKRSEAIIPCPKI